MNKLKTLAHHFFIKRCSLELRLLNWQIRLIRNDNNALQDSSEGRKKGNNGIYHPHYDQLLKERDREVGFVCEPPTELLLIRLH